MTSEFDPQRAPASGGVAAPEAPIPEHELDAPSTAGANGTGAGGGLNDRTASGMGPGPGKGFSLRNLQTFASFKNGVFRLYYVAMLGQMAAMNMQLMARSLLVYRLTGSGTALGVMALANAIPMLFFSLFGGVLADRVQKKWVLVWGQAASALVSLAIALLLITGFMSAANTWSWWLLVLASLIQGTIMGLMMPARQAIIPEIVPQKDLMNAVSLNTLGMNSLRLFAPAAAGFLIDWAGFHAIYFAMTGLYGIAVVFILLMPKTGTVVRGKADTLGEVVAGLKYIRGETTIMLVLLLTLMMVILSMPYMMLLPMFTEDVWDVGASGLGILFSVSGIGAMAGSLVLASLPNKKRGIMLLASGVVMGASLTAFSFSPTFSMALIMIVVVGIGQTGRMTLANTLLQYYVANAYRGRVMSVYMMEWGLSSFGVFFTAILADAVSPQIAIGGLAIALTVLSALSIVFVPRLRRLD
ncbi:MAG: MFS transporter [Chloroflexi bacterium]|nr:MFS transporter [Chloroflexota bacterium]